jgi:hypothetical protein
MTIDDLVQKPRKILTVVIPLGKDRSVNHTIYLIDDLIFDSTQSWALKCKANTLSWICDCGDRGFQDVNLAMQFELPYKTKSLD